jgi:uncharacterized LabA/DUF88 family protein
MYGIDYTNLLINVNQSLQDMFKSFDIDKAFNFFGVHFRAENNDRHITEPERLYRIFFYDCPPITKKLHHPITKKAVDFKKSKTALFRQDLHNQLRKTRNVALRLGFLDEKNARWTLKNPEKFKNLISGKITHTDIIESDIIYHAQQKSVDMKIGLDIASMAYKKQVNKIILISGDSDFVPAAKLARREGIEFILDSMNAPIKPDLLFSTHAHARVLLLMCRQEVQVFQYQKI